MKNSEKDCRSCKFLPPNRWYNFFLSSARLAAPTSSAEKKALLCETFNKYFSLKFFFFPALFTSYAGGAAKKERRATAAATSNDSRPN